MSGMVSFYFFLSWQMDQLLHPLDGKTEEAVKSAEKRKSILVKNE